ncbi:MAG TPA: response regulator [Candidatus Binatus sp.]|nr:response regulator [Candidatus Binatus sp.]
MPGGISGPRIGEPAPARWCGRRRHGAPNVCSIASSCQPDGLVWGSPSRRHASCAIPLRGRTRPVSHASPSDRTPLRGEQESQPILVVEDDTDLRDAMLELLRGFGRGAIGVANGEQALSILRSGLLPSVILLDLMMPGMDGWTFRREQMRDGRFARIPVIVLSAHPDPRRGGNLQGTNVLPKPLNFDRLLELLTRLSPSA